MTGGQPPWSVLGLRCALEDVQTLLSERPTKAELERSLADLLHTTGRLDRLWVTERAG